jgi:hypothetical protein
MAKDSKTIGVTIRFWNMEPGEVQPGHVWAAGTITVQANDSHAIKAGETLVFNRMAEIPLKLEEALEAAGVRLHIGQPADKLYES